MSVYVDQRRVGVRRGFLGAVSGVVARVAAVTSERRRLSELSDAQLRDIGLTRDQARAEAERPFWDLPRR